MTAADRDGFPRVTIPGGPYGFPPMTAETEPIDRLAHLEDVTAAQRQLVEDLRTQATALGLDLADLECTVHIVEPTDADFAAGRVRFRAEAELRRPRP